MTLPPIVLKKGFVPEPDKLFEYLLSSVSWDESMRARKTASFGVAYNYSQMAYPAVPMPAQLNGICDMISGALGFRPNNCLLNYYPDGESSMGFHSDSSEELMPDTGVAIVSLGAERTMIYRLKSDKTVETTVALPNGSLLYMSDSMQQDWLHAIPKAPGSPPRISMSFRSIAK